ncbi:hypothetical protein D0962_20595 [Leptolyngbyaceae cyanobacterium CCMR0082]|uniref:Uncharacterized protein n=1 Tax=Adonisia turfae CCMR0082 TaxID=2304604 RepID=A0A6M0S9I2_9CYAN|nr:hypothetical protein [Adonisia turfae]NEZ65144.1 hypothetical protein [Adonisia turfae CCMR0082]
MNDDINTLTREEVLLRKIFLERDIKHAKLEQEQQCKRQFREQNCPVPANDTGSNQLRAHLAGDDAVSTPHPTQTSGTLKEITGVYLGGRDIYW